MTRVQQLLSSSRPWLTDGGLETSLIFHDGLDLPSFAAFVLYDTAEGCRALQRYSQRYIDIARAAGQGFVLDTATWRAGMGWGAVLGYDETALRAVNSAAVAMAKALRAAHETPDTPILINGIIGPSGDGYDPNAMVTPDEAEALHRPQIEALAGAGADMVTAMTITNTGEAIGIARAANTAGLPVILSFVVETDGRLPSGTGLATAITEVDRVTQGAVLFFGVNCAHPTHFSLVLQGGWTERIGMVRANASRKSHAELDEAEDLDDGDPDEFGVLYAGLADLLPALRIVGGCCGTDHRHVSAAQSRLAHLQR